MATFGELETLWRRRAFDDIGGGGSEDNWTPVDVYRAIAEGQEQWCRLTLALEDYTSAFLQLDGAAGADQFDLDTRILKINRVKPSGGAVLQLASLSDLDLIAPTWETDPPGTPRFYLTDINARKMWVYPRPSVADTFSLTVARLPLTSTDTPLPTWTEPSTLEILPAFHLDLLHWVTYRLYDYQSRQTQTPEARWAEKSADALAKFLESIALFKGESPREKGYPRKQRFGDLPESGEG